MSYILEALRRAERERQLGKTPSVEALTQARPPQTSTPRNSLQRLLAGLTLLLLIAAIAYFALRGPAGPEPTAAISEPPAAPVVASTPPAAPAAAEPTTAPPAAPAPTATESKPIHYGRPLQASIEASEAASVIEDESDLGSLDDLAAPFNGSDRAADMGDVEYDDSGADAPAPTRAQEPERRAAPPAASTSPRPGTSASSSGAGAAEPQALRDMPSAYRARFPAVRLDVHVYNNDPSRRWIMVDGRRYREGEPLASGPRIVVIRDDGVVFEHAGERVLLPLTR